MRGAGGKQRKTAGGCPAFSATVTRCCCPVAPGSQLLQVPAAPGKAVSACWWWRVAATGWQQSLSAPPVALTQHIYWGCSQLRPAKFSEILCRSCSLFSQYSLALAGWGARHLLLSDFWIRLASLFQPDILASAWQMIIVAEQEICLAAQSCFCSAGLVAVNYLALVTVDPTLHIPATSPAPGDFVP